MINMRNTLGTTGLAGRRAAFWGLALATAAVAVLATKAAAQEHEGDIQSFTVFGHVVDSESGQALVGAWVALPETQWGSITNDEGRFRIPEVAVGRLGLTVEMLGYETLQWEGDVRAGEGSLRIELSPEPILLEGLEVMADRFRSRRNAVATNVFAYDAADLTSSSATTALEFVEYRVGAFLTQCNGRRGNTCIFTRGRTVEPVVYLDEAPLLAGLDYLESFAPWEFHMIEVYGGGRHIRLYSPEFIERAAKERILPIPITALSR